MIRSLSAGGGGSSGSAYARSATVCSDSRTAAAQRSQRTPAAVPLRSSFPSTTMPPKRGGAGGGARGGGQGRRSEQPDRARRPVLVAIAAVVGVALVIFGATQLFGGGDEASSVAVPLPEVPAWTEAQQLAAEKEALGLYMSGHPLERFSDELKAYGAKRVGELTTSEADLWVGGIVSGLRPLKTKKGDRMCVFMLDDIAGSVEVVVFPETFAKNGSLVEADAMLLVRGKLEKDEESARIVATELLPIAALKERTTREVVIHLTGRAAGRPTFEALAELLTRHRGDRRVFLELDVRSQEKPLRVRSEVAQRVRPSERLVSEVEQICGAGSVELR
jgi:DNA polymerase-3 subunit alpha